ncbi:MAG: hypothetical protein IJU12_04480 [Clostridia bacterium]|nr:hypothetical protein [Clostridia bacterium]
MTTVSDRVKRLYRASFVWLRQRDYTPLLICWATAVFYCFFCLRIGKSAAGSSGYFTYTLQALAWRRGAFSLGQDYPWLELAVFEGDWYVSFPPVPSIPLFFLTFLYGDATPDNLLVKLYVLAGCLAVYHMLKNAGYDKLSSVGFSLLCSFAGCLLSLTTEGAVWFQAQTLAFALSCLAVCCMYTGKPTPSLLFYALAVGCRPFNAVYGIPLFALYCDQCRHQKTALKQAFLRLLPGVLLGLLVACAYGWYNWARFGNPLEFGHNYLPEFSWQGGVQFSLAHVGQNIKTFVLGLPFGKGSEGWELTQFGFCFLIANPVFILLLCWMIADILRRRITLCKLLTALCFFVHLFLLLLHRTFGGYQFGARYTCDLLPYAALYLALPGHSRRMRGIEGALLIFALVFAVYGAAQILL